MAYKKVEEVPINEKMLLTAKEASVLTNIGVNSLMAWSKTEAAEPYIFHVGGKGGKLLFKREKFLDYCATMSEI